MKRGVEYYQSLPRAESLAIGALNSLKETKEGWGEERYAHEAGRVFAGSLMSLQDPEIGLSNVRTLQFLEPIAVALQNNARLLPVFVEGMLDEMNRAGILETDRTPEDVRSAVRKSPPILPSDSPNDIFPRVFNT